MSGVASGLLKYTPLGGLLGLGYSDDSEAGFYGQAAKNADEVALALATKMENAGLLPDDIWKKTGWGRGADSQWRFEADDSQFSLRPNAIRREDFDGVEIGISGGGLLNHDQLRQAYPEMLNQLTISGGLQDASGAYGYRPGSELLGTPAAHAISVSDNLMGPGFNPRLKVKELERELAKKDAISDEEWAKRWGLEPDEVAADRAEDRQEWLDYIEEVKNPKYFNEGTESTLLHELQHGVQHTEGFARGGSVKDFELAKQIHHDKMDVVAGNIRYFENKAKQTEGYKKLEDQIYEAINNHNIPEIKRLRYAQRDYVDNYKGIGKMRDELRELMAKTGEVDDTQGLYERLAGEVEARNVQTRKDYDWKQRRQTPPWKTEDVPRNRQIIKYAQAGAIPGAGLLGLLSQSDQANAGLLDVPITDDRIQASSSPTINKLGGLLQNVELPILGRDPLPGLSNYLMQFGYGDPASERLKRAGMAALDVL